MNETGLQDMTETRLQRWENRAEWPLAICAVAFLALYSIEVLAEPQGAALKAVEWSLNLLYLPFVVDYLARLRLADNRARWFFRHLLDLAVVTLPFLRPLRFLRLVALVRILHKALGDAVRGQVIAFTTCGALLLVYVAALAELKYERYAPGSQITTFPDALWWAVATLTTVGYGDHFPVTAPGRFIAVLLMIGGICLIGAAGATITHWIISQVAKDEVAQQSVTVAHIDELRDEIARLRHLLEKTTGEANGEAPPRISTTQGSQRN
jgi:voltage-gated potassium channel